MTPIMNRSSRLAHALRLSVALATVALGGCKGLLDVENQGAVDAGNLSNPAYVGILTNSVVGEFQQMTHWDFIYTEKFSGEVVNHMTYFEELDIGYRNISDSQGILGNGTFAMATFNPLHRTRWLADSVASRLKVWEGDSAGRDLRLARVRAYGAYTYVYLGEQMCSSPVSLSKPYTPTELFRDFAIPRFDEAITVATAAKAWAQSHAPDADWSASSLTRYANGADSIMNMARVGAARAALGMNDKAKAIQYASAVTPAFTSDASPGFRIYAQFLQDKINNRFWTLLDPSGQKEISLYKQPLATVTDPRIPIQLLTVYDGTKNTPVPMSTPAFDTYSGVLPGAPVKPGMGIRIASAIEAKYILAEAQGNNAANLAFINARRALGGMPALDASVSDVDFRNAVIEQRQRDMFLDGHRLGDIRRYKQYYGLDLYPKGLYPTSTSVSYGTQECFPIPVSELQGNPNANQ